MVLILFALELCLDQEGTVRLGDTALETEEGCVTLDVDEPVTVQVSSDGREPASVQVDPAHSDRVRVTLAPASLTPELQGVAMGQSRGWPLNGVVDNQSSQQILAHDCDTRETRTLGADARTDPFFEDFDYFSTDWGRTWRKVGADRVVLTDANLEAAGACVTQLCKPCPE